MNYKLNNILFCGLLLIGNLTAMDAPLPADKKTYTEAAMSAMSNVINGIGGSIKRNWSYKFDVALDVSPQAAQTLNPLTSKYHAEKGFILTIATDDGIKKIANDGVQARISIDPATIKTLFVSSTGAALAMAGIGLILYESFFVEDFATEASKPASWGATVKNFMKNRYVLGSASIAAGLCLIAKSSTL